jgi:hypothetical protein
MAKKGRRVVFHGAFGTKSDAVRKEKAGSGRFIKTVKVRGQKRYVVMSRKT